MGRLAQYAQWWFAGAGTVLQVLAGIYGWRAARAIQRARWPWYAIVIAQAAILVRRLLASWYEATGGLGDRDRWEVIEGAALLVISTLMTVGLRGVALEHEREHEEGLRIRQDLVDATKRIASIEGLRARMGPDNPEPRP